MTLQREDRNVRRNDDQHREQGRAADLDRRFEDLLQPRHAIVHVFGQPAEHVFDHDHRAVDDDAEVHGAEGKQIGGNANESEADKGCEQRERDHERHDQRGAQIAEKEDQHDRHEQRAFDEIGEHCTQRLADEPCPVVEGHDLNAPGQDRFVELCLPSP